MNRLRSDAPHTDRPVRTIARTPEVLRRMLGHHDRRPKENLQTVDIQEDAIKRSISISPLVGTPVRLIELTREVAGLLRSLVKTSWPHDAHSIRRWAFQPGQEATARRAGPQRFHVEYHRGMSRSPGRGSNSETQTE